jgi:hypothetical protein
MEVYVLQLLQMGVTQLKDDSAKFYMKGCEKDEVDSK